MQKILYLGPILKHKDQEQIMRLKSGRYIFDVLHKIKLN